MIEQFCSYEISLKLKELGFKEDCLASYLEGTIFNKKKNPPRLVGCGALYFEVDGLSNNLNYDNVSCAAPLWQQAIDWFRINKNRVITVYANASGYLWEFHDAIGGTQREWSDYSGPNDGGCWDNYEEARTQSILKAIELCKRSL